LEPTERAYDGGFLTKDEMEKKHIEEALSQCGWVVGGKKGAASLLGIPRSTLQYRMKRLGIQARQIGKATSRSSQGAMGYGLSFG